jgi:hypothetical protein
MNWTFFWINFSILLREAAALGGMRFYKQCWIYRVKKIFATRHSNSYAQKRQRKTIFALVPGNFLSPFASQFLGHLHPSPNPRPFVRPLNVYFIISCTNLFIFLYLSAAFYFWTDKLLYWDMYTCWFLRILYICCSIMLLNRMLYTSIRPKLLHVYFYHFMSIHFFIFCLNYMMLPSQLERNKDLFWIEWLGFFFELCISSVEQNARWSFE